MLASPADIVAATEDRRRRGGGRRQLPRHARLGLMIWTLIVFGDHAATCSASSPSRASRRRSTSASRRSRSRSTPPSAPATEADALLAEYRERLKEAREQAEEIVARARKAAEDARARVAREGHAPARGAAWSRRAATSRPRPAARSRRSATRSPTSPSSPPRRSPARRSTEDDQRRLVEEALAELDFAALPAERNERLDGRDRPGLRALAVRGRQASTASSTTSASSSAQFADAARRQPRAAGLLLLAVLLHRGEEGRAGARSSTAPTRSFLNFLELLIENHRMPAIFRIRARARRALGGGEQAAARADHERRRARRARPSSRSATASASRPAARSSSRSTVDPDILGGIVAARRQLDPRRLHPQPPRATSQAGRQGERRRHRSRRLTMQIKPDEITSILKSRIEGLDEGEAELTEVGTVLSIGDGIARIHGLENCMAFEMLELPARRDRPRAQPRVRQRRRRAVRRLGEDRRGRHRQAHRPACSRSRSARACSAASSTRSATRSTARATSRPTRRRPAEFKAPGVVQRQPVKEPMQTGLKAIDSMIPIGRGQRELIIGDRQTGKTAIAIDTIINNKDNDLVSIYVAIGQRMATVVGIAETLAEARRAGPTIIVAAPADEAAPIKFLAPYAGCAMARVLPLQGRARAVRLRRPHQARVRVPPDVAAAAPPAGPRGLPRRRLLPALPPARARGQAHRRRWAAAR